jgi:microcystin-dependent protein
MASIGDVRAFGFNFVPRGWKECNGQTLARKDYGVLFSQIGFAYDGVREFAVPDLRGRTALGAGGTPGNIGHVLGTETETLTIDQMPPHTHRISGLRNTAGSRGPHTTSLIGRLSRQGTAMDAFAVSAGAQAVKMHPDVTGPGDACKGQSFDNRQPYLVVTYGIYVGG